MYVQVATSQEQVNWQEERSYTPGTLKGANIYERQILCTHNHGWSLPHNRENLRSISVYMHVHAWDPPSFRKALVA